MGTVADFRLAIRSFEGARVSWQAFDGPARIVEQARGYAVAIEGVQRGAPLGSAPIQIGNGAWLGSRCTILPGVTIGAGSVIGASVVVAKDVPANVLLTGNRTISLAKWR